jgi:hypothetical protein
MFADLDPEPYVGTAGDNAFALVCMAALVMFPFAMAFWCRESKKKGGD